MEEPLDRSREKIGRLLYLSPPLDSSVIKDNLSDRFAARDAIEAMGSLRSRQRSTTASPYSSSMPSTETRSSQSAGGATPSSSSSSRATTSSSPRSLALQGGKPIPSLVSTIAAASTDSVEAVPFVTILIYDENNMPAKQLRARPDNCQLLHLSKLKVPLGQLGIELGIMNLELYRKREWVDVRSESPILVHADSIADGIKPDHGKLHTDYPPSPMAPRDSFPKTQREWIKALMPSYLAKVGQLKPRAPAQPAPGDDHDITTWVTGKWSEFVLTFSSELSASGVAESTWKSKFHTKFRNAKAQAIAKLSSVATATLEFPTILNVSGRDLFRDSIAAEINTLVTEKRDAEGLDSKKHAGLFQGELKRRWDVLSVAEREDWDGRAAATNLAAASDVTIDSINASDPAITETFPEEYKNWKDLQSSWNNYCAIHVPEIVEDSATVLRDSSGNPLLPSFDLEVEPPAAGRSILTGYLEAVWGPYDTAFTISIDLSYPPADDTWPRDRFMTGLPWEDFEAHPADYIKSSMIPDGIVLSRPANMTVSSLYAVIQAIQAAATTNPDGKFIIFHSKEYIESARNQRLRLSTSRSPLHRERSLSPEVITPQASSSPGPSIEHCTEPSTPAPLTVDPSPIDPSTLDPPTADLPTADPPTADPPTADPPTIDPPTIDPHAIELSTFGSPTSQPTSASPNMSKRKRGHDHIPEPVEADIREAQPVKKSRRSRDASRSKITAPARSPRPVRERKQAQHCDSARLNATPHQPDTSKPKAKPGWHWEPVPI
ncbi:hypothetical protein HWV62_10190 [Athelia sp. TMB]|nr:hypothetical protein HWV62_10190 [Athelia sp. TMB]